MIQSARAKWIAARERIPQAGAWEDLKVGTNIVQIGAYQARLTLDMAGDWSVDLSFQGPQGPAKLTVPVNVKE
jgi:hypothetical protein